MKMIMYGRNDDDDGDVDVVAHLLQQQLVLFDDRDEDDQQHVVAHLLKQLVLPPLTFGLKPVERLPDVVDLVFH